MTGSEITTESILRTLEIEFGIKSREEFEKVYQNFAGIDISFLTGGSSNDK